MSTTSSSTRSPPPSGSAQTNTTSTVASGEGPAPRPHIHPTIPSAETQQHVADARAAVVASMSNMVDRELQSRAAVLHDNARALDRQEKDVVIATDGLRRERERLAREADGAARRLKEVGNVQNWAEVLERQFLVLEDTVRMANGEGGDGDDGSSVGSCSCSECGRGDGSGSEMDWDGPMDGAGAGGMPDPGDGKNGSSMEAPAWSDTSPSLHEPGSSTAAMTVAKDSETASQSTAS